MVPSALTVVVPLLPFVAAVTVNVSPSASLSLVNTVVVTAIQDRYFDDSVRGEWVELTLKRNLTDIWLIKELKRAFSCRRGDNTKSFQKEFCP